MIRRVPSKLGDPVARYDDGNVTLEWTAPEHNGGADITEYVIKYGDEDTDAEQYEEESVDGNTTTFQFTDQLSERTSYRFAVAAVNAAGRRGQFSEFTDYVQTSPGKHFCNYHVSSVQLIHHFSLFHFCLKRIFPTQLCHYNKLNSPTPKTPCLVRALHRLTTHVPRMPQMRELTAGPGQL